MTMVGRELANLLILPDPDHDVSLEVQHLQKGDRALEINEMNYGLPSNTVAVFTKEKVKGKRLIKLRLNHYH